MAGPALTATESIEELAIRPHTIALAESDTDRTGLIVILPDRVSRIGQARTTLSAGMGGARTVARHRDASNQERNDCETNKGCSHGDLMRKKR